MNSLHATLLSRRITPRKTRYREQSKAGVTTRVFETRLVTAPDDSLPRFLFDVGD